MPIPSHSRIHPIPPFWSCPFWVHRLCLHRWSGRLQYPGGNRKSNNWQITGIWRCFKQGIRTPTSVQSNNVTTIIQMINIITGLLQWGVHCCSSPDPEMNEWSNRRGGMILNAVSPSACRRLLSIPKFGMLSLISQAAAHLDLTYATHVSSSFQCALCGRKLI